MCVLGVVEPSRVVTVWSLSPCRLSPAVENRQLTLDLQTENKGTVVSGGELTIFLDGPAVDVGNLPNGSAATEGECRPSPCAHGGERSGAESTAPGTSEPASECQQPPPPPGEAPARLPRSWAYARAPVGASVQWDRRGTVTGSHPGSLVA